MGGKNLSVLRGARRTFQVISPPIHVPPAGIEPAISWLRTRRPDR